MHKSDGDPVVYTVDNMKYLNGKIRSTRMDRSSNAVRFGDC